MLQRGDNMSHFENGYVQQLIHWGDEVRNKLVEERGINQEQVIEQLENWQHRLRNILHSNQPIAYEQLMELRNEGEQFLDEWSQNRSSKQPIAYGKRKLPPLPYAYNALEPYISEEIMRLHHNKHHQSYVDGLNKAEKALYGKNTDDKYLKYWLREQAFHGSGHQLHTIFWFNMTPRSSKQPHGELRTKMEHDFGSWQRFKTLFTNTANSVEGDGWAVLYWNPRSGMLGVQSFEKHQLFQIADIIPLLVLDVWEHAYYLQYKTDKKAYIDNWWNVVNWQDVNDRYKRASQLRWDGY